ncbi:hypothetical protein KUCAC02_020534, partial [Chaenocephalus aceratus]
NPSFNHRLFRGSPSNRSLRLLTFLVEEIHLLSRLRHRGNELRVKGNGIIKPLDLYMKVMAPSDVGEMVTRGWSSAFITVKLGFFLIGCYPESQYTLSVSSPCLLVLIDPETGGVKGLDVERCLTLGLTDRDFDAPNIYEEEGFKAP